MLSIVNILAVAALLYQLVPTAPQTQPVKSAVSASTPAARPDSKQEEQADIDIGTRLLKVKRIFVESFGDDPISKQNQAMVVSALTESKRFIVTENKERADAILRGAGLEKTSQELHSSSEATSAGGAAGGHSGSVSGSFTGGTGSVSGSSSGGFVSHAAAIEDASTSTETINDARIAVRLVDRDGDVIWATTQESKGAKYKGASADVADKVAKELLRMVEKIEAKPAPKPPGT